MNIIETRTGLFFDHDGSPDSRPVEPRHLAELFRDNTRGVNDNGHYRIFSNTSFISSILSPDGEYLVDGAEHYDNQIYFSVTDRELDNLSDAQLSALASEGQ